MSISSRRHTCTIFGSVYSLGLLLIRPYWQCGRQKHMLPVSAAPHARLVANYWQHSSRAHVITVMIPVVCLAGRTLTMSGSPSDTRTPTHSSLHPSPIPLSLDSIHLATVSFLVDLGLVDLSIVL